MLVGNIVIATVKIGDLMIGSALKALAVCVIRVVRGGIIACRHEIADTQVRNLVLDLDIDERSRQIEPWNEVRMQFQCTREAFGSFIFQARIAAVRPWHCLIDDSGLKAAERSSPLQNIDPKPGSCNHRDSKAQC